MPVSCLWSTGWVDRCRELFPQSALEDVETTVAAHYDKQVCSEWGHAKQLDTPWSVLFSSGFGDGVYEVWANIVNTGDFGDRVKEVRIRLIGDEE